MSTPPTENNSGKQATGSVWICCHDDGTIEWHGDILTSQEEADWRNRPGQLVAGWKFKRFDCTPAPENNPQQGAKYTLHPCPAYSRFTIDKDEEYFVEIFTEDELKAQQIIDALTVHEWFKTHVKLNCGNIVLPWPEQAAKELNALLTRQPK